MDKKYPCDALNYCPYDEGRGGGEGFCRKMCGLTEHGNYARSFGKPSDNTIRSKHCTVHYFPEEDHAYISGVEYSKEDKPLLAFYTKASMGHRKAWNLVRTTIQEDSTLQDIIETLRKMRIKVHTYKI